MTAPNENDNRRVNPLTRSISFFLSSTVGVVLMLLAVQFVTGTLLVFYYVPSVDHAHTTVSFVEKVVSSGSWLRSLHHYGSILLPLFIFLHLVRLLSAEAYNYRKVSWVATVLLLALVMAGGGTGYSLPWDARAFFSTRVAEGLMGGLPFVGRMARLWLLGGSDISTLTLSRFFALHVLVTPFLILLVVAWRFDDLRTCREALVKNSVVAGIVFLLLAVWCVKYHAPLGPAITEVSAEYLPRPGGQFLWLYQSLKYLPGGLGSIVGVVVPGLGLLMLLTLPWLDRISFANRSQHFVGGLILSLAAIWIVTMTTTSVLADRRDLRIRQQLAKQQVEEDVFFNSPFQSGLLGVSSNVQAGANSSGAPRVYLEFCANCHGQHGEGARQGTLRFPALLGVGAKPQRTVNDIMKLLDNPLAYGIQPPMRSFADKLNEDEKRTIAEWIVKL